MLHLFITVALCVAPASGGAAGAGAMAQTKPQAEAPASRSADDPVAEAYQQFIQARRLEDSGDIDGAIKAYQRAMELDPSSADVPAALAGLFARQSRVRDAIESAEGALRRDPENAEAHRILGSIYAEMSERQAGAAGAQPAAYALQAIDHLERALGDPRQGLDAGVRLTLGRLYLKNKAFDKAIGVLRQLLADEPWMPQGVALLLQAYTAGNRPNDAIALLKDAVDVEPSYYNTLGEAYQRDRRWAEAADAFGKAAALAPRDLDLKTRWAYALLNQPGDRNATRARDLLLEVTATNSTAAWPLYLLARAQRELGDLDGSERTARRLLAISPTSTWGAHALAQVLEARRQYAALIDALEPIAAKPPQAGHESDTTLLLTHLGFAYLELGRSDRAVEAFERASKQDPDDGALKAYLAQALLSARQYDRALALAREQRVTAVSDVRLARLEADALRGQGKFDAGVAILKPLADAPGDDSLGVRALSEYFAADHRYEDAAQILVSGLKRFPQDLGLLFQYGAMLERQKRYAEAERVFRDVIARDPRNGAALNYLGYTLAERGERLDEALALIQRAVELDPFNGAYLDSLGWAYFKLNRLDLAESNLRAAAEQLVRDSVVQNHRGDVLFKQGRYAEAVEAWRRSLAGDGELIDRAEIERKIRDAQPKLPRN